MADATTYVPFTKENAIATIAAALINVRGDASLAAIRAALEDAKFTLFPGEHNDKAYKAWQVRVGDVAAPEHSQVELARKRAVQTRALGQ